MHGRASIEQVRPGISARIEIGSNKASHRARIIISACPYSSVQLGAKPGVSICPKALPLMSLAK